MNTDIDFVIWPQWWFITAVCLNIHHHPSTLSLSSSPALGLIFFLISHYRVFLSFRTASCDEWSVNYITFSTFYPRSSGHFRWVRHILYSFPVMIKYAVWFVNHSLCKFHIPWATLCSLPWWKANKVFPSSFLSTVLISRWYSYDVLHALAAIVLVWNCGYSPRGITTLWMVCSMSDGVYLLHDDNHWVKTWNSKWW